MPLPLPVSFKNIKWCIPQYGMNAFTRGGLFTGDSTPAKGSHGSRRQLIADLFISRSSIVVASVGRQVLPAPDTETAPSLVWFVTIQCIESKQDLTGLAPKVRFIPAQPVERIAWQIGPSVLLEERHLSSKGLRT
jgi:hypothetical protein